MKVYRIEKVQGVDTEVEVIELKEATYTGKDMGERKIVATIKYPSPIDFHIGDYVKLEIADLVRNPGASSGNHYEEKFYIYTLPTIKKTARSMSVGDAFEHTVTFFPRQYELATVMMRDIVQEQTASGIVYTGYDEFSFYGGAKTLLDRIMAVLEERFKHIGTEGVDYWAYKLAPEINEDDNPALEKYQFDFSSNTVLDALVKLSDAEGIDTTFFINGRMIWVGYKCPMVCALATDSDIIDDPYIFHYGKTSHKAIYDNNGGGLFNITKSIGTASPITRLFAYGDTRNLNRFYCSDRLASGRYVNRLMLPSFDADGKTDFIDSPSGIAKFGVREGKKEFSEIYPSLRYITYGDLRQIKYVLKLMDNGEENLHGPLCRIQCYKVEPHPTNTGVNRLVEAWPEEPLVVCVHANGKVCKVILQTSLDNQSALDGQSNVPSNTGSCYCVHQGTEYSGSGESSPVTVKRFANYANYKAKAYTTRSMWFGRLNNPGLTPDQKEDLSTFQINYGDDARITDVYLCRYTNTTPAVPLYDAQRVFTRDGYSAYCWPHVNDLYVASQSDAIQVNEVLGVTPILTADTDWEHQQSFDIYLRDIGFKLNEQTPMGTKVHIVGETFNLEFLDGYLAGVTFEAAETKINGSAVLDSVCCRWNDNGTENSTFFTGADDQTIATEAANKGAIWRITVKRNDSEYDQYGVILPNQQIQAKEGDHLVFLNIYMPDIYVHAAENRLLKEAQKFLNDNDNGDVNYTMEFDQIRLAQIPKLGLQMREGAIMRIVDEDLQIQSEKESQYLFNDPNGITSKASFLEYDTSIEYAKVYDSTTTREVRLENTQGRAWHATISDVISGYDLLDVSECPVAIRVIQHFLNGNDVVVTIEPTRYLEIQRSAGVIEATFEVPMSIRARFTPDPKMLITDVEYEAILKYSYDSAQIVENGKYVPVGKEINCAADFLANFQSGHYYEVVIDIQDDLRPILDAHDYPRLCLTDSVGDGSVGVYYPETTCVEVTNEEQGHGLPPSGYSRYLYKFMLPQAFSDGVPYYVAVTYIAQDDSPEYGTIRLLSIYESNTSDGSTELNYVDLTIDDITIQITSSGREYSLGGTSSSGGSGSASGGSKGDNKKITANVKQKQRATVWQQMNAQVKSNAILSEQNQQTAASLAQNARKNVRNLEALKGSIFDPDGTINDVFLQMMMLQVGADSMNYSLDKTRVFNGVRTNITMAYNSGLNKWSISLGADVLRHFVYTDPIDTWNVSYMLKPSLNPDILYYIAIKCPRATGTGAVWVVSTDQHKVDEDPDYWYFNYGIILPTTSTTERVIMETRGNAYMYGDNVIAGKIVTIDGNSYLDLTGGAFKLGNQLLFQNGVLMLGSTNPDNINNVLSRLGTAESDILTKAATTYVNSIRDDLQAQIDGAIDTWFYAGVPTLNNLPASQWTDDTTKNLHTGDIYYDKNTGSAYRFVYDNENDEYLWTPIPDDEIATALKMAADAQATADGKMTAFASAPTNKEYKVGDMWIQGSTGKVLYSINDRDAGEYQASDWVSASLYAETLAMMEQGGENLIGETNPYQINPAPGNNRYFPLVGDLNTIDGSDAIAINGDLLDANTKYVFSFDSAFGISGGISQFQAGLIWKDANSIIQYDLKLYNIGSTRQTGVYTTPALVSGATKCAFIIYAGVSGNTSGVGLQVISMMLQKGEKATAYGSYTKHLANALKGTTEIAGGLVMTNVLMLKDENGDVQAGMSGQTGTVADPENVLLWGGGDYQDALAAVGGGTPLPVLLTKNGENSRIGCFKIEGKDSVRVDNGGMTVYITTKSINDQSVIGGLTQKTVERSDTETTGEAHTYTPIDIQIPLAADSFYAIENFSVIVHGEPISPGHSIQGSASVTVKVTLGDTVLQDAAGTSVNEIIASGTSGDNSRYYQRIEGTSIIARMLRIQCYNITASRGTYSIRFSYKAGAESDFRCCVIAKDGLMISSGHNKQFYVKPDLTNLHMLCNLPSYDANMQIGEMYVDEAGFVRQKIKNDDEQFTFKLGVAGTILSGGYKRGTLDLSDFVRVILPSS